ncbi:unnamed protein product, partial [Didymodactylos carnosus]
FFCFYCLGLESEDESNRRTGVMKFLSNLLPNSDNSDENDHTIKLPFSDDEHLQLSGKYIVNHKELSSIIAHALSMSEYESRLNEIEQGIMSDMTKVSESPITPGSALQEIQNGMSN